MVLIFVLTLTVVCYGIKIEPFSSLITVQEGIYKYIASSALFHDDSTEYVFISNFLSSPVPSYAVNIYDNYGSEYNKLNYLVPYNVSLYSPSTTNAANTKLASCTSPINNDILTCYLNSFNIDCILLSQNKKSIPKKWELSAPIIVFSSSSGFDSNILLHTICVNDGYLIFLSNQNYPSSNYLQYNLLDLKLNQIEPFGQIYYNLNNISNYYTKWIYNNVLKQSNDNILIQFINTDQFYKEGIAAKGINLKYNGINAKNSNYLTITNYNAFNLTHNITGNQQKPAAFQPLAMNINNDCCYIQQYTQQYSNDPVYYIGLTNFNGDNVLDRDFEQLVGTNINGNYRSIALDMLNNDKYNKYFLIYYQQNYQNANISGDAFEIHYDYINDKYSLSTVALNIFITERWSREFGYNDYAIISNNKLFLSWTDWVEPNVIMNCIKIQTYNVSFD